MNDKAALAPPGAGLPPLELLVSRLGFRALRTSLSRRRLQAWLCYETERLVATARTLPQDQWQRQVLIPRIAGLEDNSRNWSAAMVLQHVVIVDTEIREILTALSEGKALGRETRIAEVKPISNAGQEQLAQVEQALAAYLERIATIKGLHTVRRHAHPWFGPLDGHGWHTLAAVHTMIHRRQLESVVRIIKKSP